MDSALVELAMAITAAPLLALGAACFDPIWCRGIITATGLNLGKIWISGAIVAALMVVLGMEYGIAQTSSMHHWIKGLV